MLPESNVSAVVRPAQLFRIGLLSMVCAWPWVYLDAEGLLPPPAQMIAGELVELRALSAAEGPAAVLSVEFFTESGPVVVVQAHLLASAAAAGPVRYRLEVPSSLSGAVRLRLAGSSPDDAPYLVQVVARKTAASRVAQPDPVPGADGPPGSGEQVPPLIAADTGFHANEPVYAVVAAHREVDVKFQISFAYQLLGEGGMTARPADASAAPLGLYFGYTQTSIWDISEESAPFRDTSYRPSLGLQHPAFWKGTNSWGEWRLAVSTGLEHESNGRGGVDSRSLNIAWLRPTLVFTSGSGWSWQASAKTYAFLDKEENPRIDEFRGYVDWKALVRMPGDGTQLAALVRFGKRSGQGSVQLELSHPLRFLGLRHGYLLAQLFSGDGETLLEFDRQAPGQVRLGFAAVR